MTKTKSPKPVPHVPNEGSKSYRLLALLLAGRTIDPRVAFDELNLPTVQARVSELRRLGWPVRSIERPHPRLPGETMVEYSLDSHFRAWMTENPGKHPGEYPFKDGRGKFADMTVEEFKR